MVTLNSQNKIDIHKRNCGFPKVAKGYWYVDPDTLETADVGLEELLWCPTVDVRAYNLPNVGMVILPYTNAMTGKVTWHVFDHIGDEYPNPADWLEEIKRYGFHQAFVGPGNFSLPVHLLDEESCYFAWHDRGGITETKPYLKDWKVRECPKGLKHKDGSTCVSWLWEDLIKGVDLGKRKVRRDNASFSYEGFAPPAGANGQHFPAIFMKLSLGRLARVLIYKDGSAEALHERTLKNLEGLNQQLFQVEFVSLGGDTDGI